MYRQSVPIALQARKSTNNDLQNTTQKTKDGRVCSCCSSNARHGMLKLHEHHLIWKLCWAPVCINKYKKHEPPT